VSQWTRFVIMALANRAGSGPKVSRLVYGSRPHVPDYMIKSGVKYRLVTDHLGSVRLVVNATTGETVSRIDYDVWGQVTHADSLSFQPFGFAGGLRDDATGLVRFGARDYDPHVGRWTAKDPIGFKGGTNNLQEYTTGDPVDFVDPSGLIIRIGGDDVFKEKVNLMISKIQGSSHGNGMVEKLQKCKNTYDIIPASRYGGADYSGRIIMIDPDWHPVVSTSKGPEAISSEILLAHEMGHLLGVRDDGDRRMNNVIANENPVRVELGYPIRTSYMNTYMGD